MSEERLTEIMDIISTYPQTPYYPNICNELIQSIINLLKENQQLKNNWNELKKWLEDKINIIDMVYLGVDKKNYSDEIIDAIPTNCLYVIDDEETVDAFFPVILASSFVV